MNFVSSCPRHILMEIDGVIASRSSRCDLAGANQLEFVPHAMEALSLLADAGYSAILFAARPHADASLAPSGFDSAVRRFLLDVALAGGHVSRLYSWTDVLPDAALSFEEQSGLLFRARVDFSLTPCDTIFLGSSPSLLDAASAAGYRALHIRRGAFLEGGADCAESPHLASSLYEVALRLASDSPSVFRIFQSHLRHEGGALRATSLRKAAAGTGR